MSCFYPGRTFADPHLELGEEGVVRVEVGRVGGQELPQGGEAVSVHSGRLQGQLAVKLEGLSCRRLWRWGVRGEKNNQDRLFFKWGNVPLFASWHQTDLVHTETLPTIDLYLLRLRTVFGPPTTIQFNQVL